jgi:N-acetylmuramoyl-L-alanine amidase
MIKICIDPGHGGLDRANKGKNGYVEADGVLKISKYLKTELEKTGQFQVVLTRTIDVSIALSDRGKIGSSNDMFISQHTNAGGGTGAEVYYSVDLPNDKNLAAKLSKATADALGISNRGAKTRESANYPGEDYYTVIDKAQDLGCPHVFIIENLLKIAQAQAKVICEFYGIGKVDYEKIIVEKDAEIKRLQDKLNQIKVILG